MNEVPRMLPDLVGSSQEADLKNAEEEYLRDRAAREELFARSRAPGSMTLSKLLKQMYGDEAAQAQPEPTRQPPTSKEPANVKPAESFPPPPTRR